MSTTVDIRLFGALELKSPYGCVVEKPGEKPHLFLLLKYLLLEPQREAEQQEVLRLVWEDKNVASSALRVRLLRLREMLEPLLPKGGKPFITFKAGKYGLEFGYTLHFDTDDFNNLLKRIDTYPLNDPEGLKFCQEALKLLRGSLLEYTEDTAWLVKYRSFYQREFIRLGHETLSRMKALGDTSAVALLSARAVMLAPEEEALQKELLAFLAEHKMENELAQHMRLLDETGKTPWLKSIAQTRLCEQKEAASRTVEDGEVLVRLFGDFELRNQHGHMIENRSRTPLLLLKYILLKHPGTVGIDEILQLWPVSKAGVNPESTVAVRLRRAREALRPLQLDKKKGLIHYHNGKFWINPSYTLKRDIDEFSDIIKKLSTCPPNDPEGLKLCRNALDLFRGPLIEYTQSAPWLEEYRSYYRDAFCWLAIDTLNRIRTLDAKETLPLLMQRTVSIAPECQKLQEDIIHYLTEQKMELELIRYLSQLARSGKAQWIGKASLN